MSKIHANPLSEEQSQSMTKMKTIEINFEDFLITTDKTKMDILAIHDFLSNYSGWSDNIPLEKVKDAIDNSLNFGLFHKEKQIGFA